MPALWLKHIVVLHVVFTDSLVPPRLTISCLHVPLSPQPHHYTAVLSSPGHYTAVLSSRGHYAAVLLLTLYYCLLAILTLSA